MATLKSSKTQRIGHYNNKVEIPPRLGTTDLGCKQVLWQVQLSLLNSD